MSHRTPTPGSIEVDPYSNFALLLAGDVRMFVCIDKRCQFLTDVSDPDKISPPACFGFENGGYSFRRIKTRANTIGMTANDVDGAPCGTYDAKFTIRQEQEGSLG